MERKRAKKKPSQQSIAWTIISHLASVLGKRRWSQPAGCVRKPAYLGSCFGTMLRNPLRVRRREVKKN